MKKQSTIHRSNRVRESETPTTQFPVQAFSETQPKGLHSGSSAGTTRLSAGAAEAPHTKPVGDQRRTTHPGGRKQP
jgi:hypothetical protein